MEAIQRVVSTADALPPINLFSDNPITFGESGSNQVFVKGIPAELGGGCADILANGGRPKDKYLRTVTIKFYQPGIEPTEGNSDLHDCEISIGLLQNGTVEASYSDRCGLNLSDELPEPISKALATLCVTDKKHPKAPLLSNLQVTTKFSINTAEGSIYQTSSGTSVELTNPNGKGREKGSVNRMPIAYKSQDREDKALADVLTVMETFFNTELQVQNFVGV